MLYNLFTYTKCDIHFARAYNGQNSSWYQAAVQKKAGRIYGPGMTKDVAFKPVAGSVKAKTDNACLVKYHNSPNLDSMFSDRACGNG